MPFLKRNPEDAPVSGDPASTFEPTAIQRPQTLTLKLLDSLIDALERVIVTTEAQASRRAAASLTDALKLVDHLYPYTKEFRDAANPLPETHELPPLDNFEDVPA